MKIKFDSFIWGKQLFHLTKIMLEQFEETNIPLLVDRVMPLWKVRGMNDSFNRLYVEMIIRTNMHENGMQFQMSGKNGGSSGNLKAICFGAKLNDARSDEWYKKTLESLSYEERTVFENGRRYLLGMEEKTFSFMTEDDVKLCLFISLEKGWGTKILSGAQKYFVKAGFKKLYLWTDGECNVDWYFKNGFELVLEEEYSDFSRPGNPYMTYVFRKKL